MPYPSAPAAPGRGVRAREIYAEIGSGKLFPVQINGRIHELASIVDAALDEELDRRRRAAGDTQP